VRALAADDGVAWVYPATADAIAGGALVCDGLVSGAGVVANYATVGDGWDGPGRGSADLSYTLTAGAPTLDTARQMPEIARALAEWARYADVHWRPAKYPNAGRSLTIFWGPRNHGDGYPFTRGVLAHAFYPAPPGLEPVAGDIHLNDEFQWGIGDPLRYDIYSVVLHEAGHSLGLAHSTNPSSVMYPMYRGIVPGLGDEDVAAIQSLYAARSLSPLSKGWNDAAIGGRIDGAASEQGATFTISASGRDVWDRADELRFVSRTLDGDGDVIARVDSLDAGHRWAKAGIMIRGSADAGAPHAFMLVSGGRGLAFQRRTAQNGLSIGTDGGPGTAPQWLWLSRRGNIIEAHAAADGGAWRLVGTDTIALGAQVLAGLAVSAHDPDAMATAVFSNVAVRGVAAWTSNDVGAVGVRGSARASAGGIRVAGAGADIWGDADAFHFVWRTLSGDGDIVARVASVQFTKSWSKAGVMIRESLDPRSPHALMLVSAGKGHAFQRRVAQGGETSNTFAGTGTAPQWVRLSRRGNLVTAFRSIDGAVWIRVGAETIPMGRDVLAGLAVSSHVTSATAQAIFEDVRVQ
jgi:regulation of enolase protein 1 (concanavalin A-like superfamily)